jgi:hypothetical protein
VSDEVADDEDAAAESEHEEEQSDDVSEPGLHGVPNSRRAQIRKLYSAFPTSTIAVCKYILDGTDGDLDEAYEAMTIGFKPVLYKVALTETSEERLEVPKIRSKKRKAVIEESEEQDSMQVEMDDSMNPLFEHYDQNGLPPGSIASGKALSVMAEVINSSPSRPRPSSTGSGTSGKNVKFSKDVGFSNGLTSTPFIGRESLIEDGAKDDSSSSEDTSSSGSSSSEDESEAAQVSEDTSTSGSDSDDSSSDSSSESDDAPEETSSKPSSTISVTPQQPQKPATKSIANSQLGITPGSGRKSTKSRNQRRRDANLLDRYKSTGILPAGTTLSEFSQLKEGLNADTSPEDASAALEAVRSAVAEEGEVEATEEEMAEKEELTGRALAKADEFEARRAALLSSIQSGGIDVDKDFSNALPESSIAEEEPGVSQPPSVAVNPSRKVPKSPSKAPETPTASTTPSKTPSKSPSKPLEILVVSVTPSNRASRSPSKVAEQPEKSATPSKRISKSPYKGPAELEVASTPSRATKSPSKAPDALDVAATPSRASRSPSEARQNPMASTPSKAATALPFVFTANTGAEATSPAASHVSVAADEQPAFHEFSTAPELHQSTPVRTGSDDQVQEHSERLQNSTTAKEATPETLAQSKTPTPSARSAKDIATPTRRPRLNLGAVNRFIFGDLKKKAPKTKEDEERLRAEFDKDIRPVLTPKPAEEIPEAVEEVPEEDLDAWKEKINYRAVECCYDVVLSEPPFPFEQRWDPQQQYGYSQQGKRGGKRKQDMRDQSQYYDTQKSPKKQRKRKGKHNYAEEQEYLDATYEPSYQDDSMDLSYGEPTQDTRLLSDDIDGEINQQLMNDLNDTSAGAIQGPEDLPPLPSNPSSLPDLQEGQVKPGMIIAFKILIFGEETAWTPQYSEYLTATVIDILENGDICVQLAFRDREQRQKKYDHETGRRIYGRFEMPEDSDDEDNEKEDDGKLSKPFKQLLNPKIVSLGELKEEADVDESSLPKNPPSTDDSVTLSHEHEEEPAEAQFSHVTETQLGSDSPEIRVQEATEPEQAAEQPEESRQPDHEPQKPYDGPDEESNTPQEPSHQRGTKPSAREIISCIGGPVSSTRAAL